METTESRLTGILHSMPCVNRGGRGLCQYETWNLDRTKKVCKWCGCGPDDNINHNLVVENILIKVTPAQKQALFTLMPDIFTDV